MKGLCPFEVVVQVDEVAVELQREVVAREDPCDWAEARS